jgi:hypothetical protein
VKTNPFGYIFGALLPPTLNILFAPIYALFIGKPEVMVFSAIAMCTIWTGLEAICILTFTPIIWALRSHISIIPLSAKAALTLAVAFSVLASLLLCHTPRNAYVGWWIWATSFFSAVFAFSAVQPRSKALAAA